MSILLYRCTTWTLTKRIEEKGICKRMVRALLNKSWKQHPMKQHLYGHLPPISKILQIRRTRHVGYCCRSKDVLISDVLLSTPSHGRSSVGQLTRAYLQQFCTDTGCCLEDLPDAMDDRDEWRGSEKSVLVERYDDDEYIIYHIIYIIY